MVQLLVTVSAAGPRQQQSYQLLDCTPDTTVADVKRRALEAAVANGTAAVPGAGGEEDVAAAASLQELTFLGQCCKDDKQLADYGVCETWVAQVAGFVLAPRR